MWLGMCAVAQCDVHGVVECGRDVARNGVPMWRVGDLMCGIIIVVRSVSVECCNFRHRCDVECD